MITSDSRPTCFTTSSSDNCFDSALLLLCLRRGVRDDHDVCVDDESLVSS